MICSIGEYFNQQLSMHLLALYVQMRFLTRVYGKHFNSILSVIEYTRYNISRGMFLCISYYPGSSATWHILALEGP